MTAQAGTKQVRDARTVSVVASLVDHGLVDAAREHEAVEVVDGALAGQSLPSPLRQRFAELAGYVGGAFVVAAAAIFFAERFGTMTSGQQVALLAGLALLLAVAGLGLALLGGGFAVLRAGREPVRRRLAGVLFTGAAGAAGFAVGLQIETSGPSHDASPGLGAALTILAVAAVGYLLAPTVVGQIMMAGSAFAAVPFALDLAGDINQVAYGLVVLALGLIWLLLAERGIWREVASGRVIGAVLAVMGAQMPLFGGEHAWVAYLATAAVAAAGFAMYVARPAWPYLAVGVVGVTLAVPEALLDWTDGTLGSAGVLLIAGITLLVACLAGLRLRKEVVTA